VTADPGALTTLLDQLDELRAKATPGPWSEAPWSDTVVLPATWAAEAVLPEDRGPFAAIYATSDADAALIVAAVNAVPQLTAAVRAVLELANDYDDGSEWGAALFRGDVIRSAIRAAIGDALSVTP
jgi:hypothetical protein